MRSEVRAGRRKSVHVGWLRRRWTGVHGEQGPIKAGGARARAERTLNMLPMSVTVEVSKLLSDWSNDAVSCRESRGGHTTCGPGWPGGSRVCVGRDGSASGMHGKGPTQGVGGQRTHGAHREHVAHVLDLGRVEAAERLVEHCRVLCRVKGRAYDAERGAGWEAEECACGLVAAQAVRCVQGEQGPIKAGGARARAGRTQNMPDMSVTVEVSKMLSDWSNEFALC